MRQQAWQRIAGVLDVRGLRFRWSRARRAYVLRHAGYMIERTRRRAWLAWPARGMLRVVHGRGPTEAFDRLDRELCAVLDDVLRFGAIQIAAVQVRR